MTTINTYPTIPAVTFKLREAEQWITRNTDDIFKGRTVIVFALPGAFTPTCSSSHLPRYNELAPVFNDYGVDEIICLSVNDTFVMNAWKQQQAAENISFIGDGNGDFSAGMGMLVDKADLGFGQRSWRYSMLVKDGVIEKMFVEEDVPGDPFKVSDADTMLNYIAPEHQLQASVSVFTKPGCPFCVKAKSMLKEHGIAFEEITLGDDATITSLRAISGETTVPQVFVGGKHIGGSEALESYLTK